MTLVKKKLSEIPAGTRFKFHASHYNIFVKLRHFESSDSSVPFFYRYAGENGCAEFVINTEDNPDCDVYLPKIIEDWTE